jgi:hypothetical protein
MLRFSLFIGSATLAGWLSYLLAIEIGQLPAMFVAPLVLLIAYGRHRLACLHHPRGAGLLALAP